MTVPDFYIIAESIGTAYWLREDHAILGCPLLENGTPDWDSSFAAQASYEQEQDVLVGLTAIGELVEFVKMNDRERP